MRHVVACDIIAGDIIDRHVVDNGPGHSIADFVCPLDRFRHGDAVAAR
jgi:hypothetical protein